MDTHEQFAQQNQAEILEKEEKDKQIQELQDELKKLREEVSELRKVPDVKEKSVQDIVEEIEIVAEILNRKRTSEENQEALTQKKAKIVERPDSCGCSKNCCVIIKWNNQQIAIDSISIMAGILNAQKNQDKLTIQNLLFYAKRIDADEEDKIMALRMFAFCPNIMNYLEGFEKWKSAVDKFKKLIEEQMRKESKLTIMILLNGLMYKTNEQPLSDEEIPDIMEKLSIKEDLEIHIIIESKNSPKYYEKLAELLRKRNVADTTITAVPNTINCNKEDIEKLIGSLKVHDKVHITTSPLTSKIFAGLLW